MYLCYRINVMLTKTKKQKIIKEVAIHDKDTGSPDLLNTRPRKRFGGKTPLEVLLEKTGVAISY